MGEARTRSLIFRQPARFLLLLCQLAHRGPGCLLQQSFLPTRAGSNAGSVSSSVSAQRHHSGSRCSHFHLSQNLSSLAHPLASPFLLCNLRSTLFGAVPQGRRSKFSKQSPSPLQRGHIYQLHACMISAILRACVKVCRVRTI